MKKPEINSGFFICRYKSIKHLLALVIKYVSGYFGNNVSPAILYKIAAQSMHLHQSTALRRQSVSLNLYIKRKIRLKISRIFLFEILCLKPQGPTIDTLKLGPATYDHCQTLLSL